MASHPTRGNIDDDPAGPDVRQTSRKKEVIIESTLGHTERGKGRERTGKESRKEESAMTRRGTSQGSIFYVSEKGYLILTPLLTKICWTCELSHSRELRFS